MEIKLINTQLDYTGEFINNQADSTKSDLNQSPNNQLLTPQDLEIKRSAILKRTSNDPELERDFRRACALYENQKSDSNPQIKRAYWKYVKAYHKITSLYWLRHDLSKSKILLHVFDTEKEIEKIYNLGVHKKLSNFAGISLLPNGELFRYATRDKSGIMLIIDSNYKIRLIQSGIPCSNSSTIYFNGNVYCFGGENPEYRPLKVSSKFDLDKNRWIKLTQLPQSDYNCHNAIFNGNILISGFFSRNILIYSIDIDSFSSIPYKFNEGIEKLLINTERLYLIECMHNGLVYESEPADEYSWKIICISIIGGPNIIMCGLYNKQGIYIISDGYKREYLKLDFGKKEMLDIYAQEK